MNIHDKGFYALMFFLLAVMVSIGLIGTFGPKRESDAMKVCQLSHSHDVCFQTLNR